MRPCPWGSLFLRELSVGVLGFLIGLVIPSPHLEFEDTLPFLEQVVVHDEPRVLVIVRKVLRLPTIFETRPNRKLESPESLMIL